MPAVGALLGQCRCGIVTDAPAISHCETTRLHPLITCRSLTSRGFGGLPTRFTMQPKWIALGLFVAGLASLLIGAGLPYLKHLAIGLTSVLA